MATVIVTLERLRGLSWTDMGLALAVGCVLYGDVDGTVLSGVICCRGYLIWQDLTLLTWSQPKRAAAEVFHFVNGVPIPMSFENHPSLVSRDLSSPLAPFHVSLAAMYETSSSSLAL